nr:glutathione S-transferase family protein [Mesorhizobium sp. WSM3879]
MLSLWGRPESTCVAKVAWTLSELGLSYHSIEVGGPHGGTRDPRYLRMNPTGLIPTLEHDGFFIWQSNAILRYICNSFNGRRFYPENPHKRALVDQWMDYSAIELQNSIGLFRTLVRRDNIGESVDVALRFANERVSVLSSTLARSDYLAGDDFTLADLSTGPLIHRWNLMIGRNAPGNLAEVTAWYDRLLQRPAFHQKVVEKVSV